jgi:hypothetical protein
MSTPASTSSSPSASVSTSPAVFIVPDNVSQGSYLQAASVNPSTLQHPTASMPSIPITFLGGNGKPVLDAHRQAYLDTGCNCNLMSRSALERDLKLLGPKAVVKNIKPFSVSMADGQTKSYCSQVLLDARIVIGHGVYDFACLIVDQLAVDYLIGFAWQLTYNVQVKPQSSSVSLGVTP